MLSSSIGIQAAIEGKQGVIFGLCAGDGKEQSWRIDWQYSREDLFRYSVRSEGRSYLAFDLPSVRTSPFHLKAIGPSLPFSSAPVTIICYQSCYLFVCMDTLTRPGASVARFQLQAVSAPVCVTCFPTSCPAPFIGKYQYATPAA